MATLLIFPTPQIAFLNDISSTIRLFPDPYCETPLKDHDVPEWIAQIVRAGSAIENDRAIFFAGGR